ncbi:Flp pilus assembly protein TadG [Hephaestia caeni]|uniref:Flp pilus assembly protein TadG n=1 Tax=Hephaestia caeni TaxID=645617 RepID=A0A397NGM7_9SPHN|nr:TadE/TadG family type IV pilus assembly protein [Hephaestia caeni]RIA36682.1 Flp pilus assembly protein TadG [Hephaestia caeni]
MRDGIEGHRKYTFRRRARALARDTRGATIIEFAIVALPFIALLIAILQTSLVFFAQQTLETTSEETARQLVTGAAQKAGMSKSDFKEAACENLPSFMSCDNLMIDVQTVDSFADADTKAPALQYDSDGKVENNWKFEPGGAGSIVVMRTMYLFPVIGGPFGFDLSNSGDRRLLIATSVFKSEPYLT